MKTITILAVSVCIAGAGGWWYLGRGSAAAPEFRTMSVKRGDLVVIVSATGRVEPVEVVDVGAQVLGRIKSFGTVPGTQGPGTSGESIDYGSKVKKGTILVQIDDALYQGAASEAKVSLRLAEAKIGRFRARASQAEKDWQRAVKLGTAIAQAEFDEYKAAHEIAQADVKVAEAEIEKAKVAVSIAQINLSYTTIKSPIDGIVIDRLVDIGQTVVTGLDAPSLFLLAQDLSEMQVIASVSEADIGHIFSGQKVAFKVDAYPDDSFDGEVSQIRLNATTSRNVVTYAVIVKIKNPDEKLLPYMTASLKFEVASASKVVLVPGQALRWEPELSEMTDSVRRATIAVSADNLPKTEPDSGTVWVVADDGLVRPIRVKIGLSDFSYNEVTGGELRPDMKVVVGTREQGDAGFGGAFVPKHNIFK